MRSVSFSGVKIEHATVGGLPALLAGVNAGRYQFAFGPIGDFKEREAANDFVDWVQEFVVFATLKGQSQGHWLAGHVLRQAHLGHGRRIGRARDQGTGGQVQG
jgi:hypothetical protein